MARDLLEIIAEQQNEAPTRDEVPTPITPLVPNDERIPALVGLLVLGLALALFTAPRSPRDQGAAASTQPRAETLTPAAP